MKAMIDWFFWFAVALGAVSTVAIIVSFMWIDYRYKDVRWITPQTSPEEIRRWHRERENVRKP